MLHKNDLLCFVLANYSSTLNKSVISMSKNMILRWFLSILMRVSHDFGWYFATRIQFREAKMMRTRIRITGSTSSKCSKSLNYFRDRRERQEAATARAKTQVIYLKKIILDTARPEKHARVSFLVPCIKWLVQCTLLYNRTLDKTIFKSYQKHTAMYNVYIHIYPVYCIFS